MNTERVNESIDYKAAHRCSLTEGDARVSINPDFLENEDEE